MGDDEDEQDLGYLRIFIPACDSCYRLIICYRDPDRPSYALLTFSVIPDSEGHITEFNGAFHSAADAIAEILGPPSATGDHRLSFRIWPYAYQRWSLAEGEFTLMQDEFDILDGLDITLWIQRLARRLSRSPGKTDAVTTSRPVHPPKG